MDSLEEWRPVIGFEGHYEVSNKGNVRSLDRTIFDLNGKRKRFIKGVALKPSKDKDGYCFMSCATTPKFTYDGFRLVDAAEIKSLCPSEFETIKHFSFE